MFLDNRLYQAYVFDSIYLRAVATKLNTRNLKPYHIHRFTLIRCSDSALSFLVTSSGLDHLQGHTLITSDMARAKTHIDFEQWKTYLRWTETARGCSRKHMM